MFLLKWFEFARTVCVSDKIDVEGFEIQIISIRSKPACSFAWGDGLHISFEIVATGLEWV